MLVGRGRREFCSSLAVSAICQFLCACLVLWLFPAVRPPQSTRESNYAVIPVLTMRSIRYQPIVVSRISTQEVGGRAGERRDRLTALLHPNLPRAIPDREITEVESWAAPVVGTPDSGFAAPLTLSLDQPSRPVELRIGDFGVANSAIGSPRAGRGTRNGFLESGFGGGYGGGQERMDWEPVRIISKPTPVYTEEARNKKIEGDVIVDLIFTADRRIMVVRILRTLGFGLDETAVQAVSQIVFRPATENGRAIDFEARARVEFRLVPLVDCDRGDGL